MGSCAAPSAKGDDKFITTDYLQQCQPVAAPKATADYLRYFCAADTTNKEQLKANEPKRLTLYKLTASLLRAYAAIANEMEEAGYTREESKAIAAEVDYFEKVRTEVKLASGDYIDLKMYEPAMRHLIDTYIGAHESEKLSAFDDLSLIQLIVERGPDAIKALPVGLSKDKGATAEAIENNLRKVIIDERPINPKYYDEMSDLLDSLIKERHDKALEYEEYLKKIVELTKIVVQPQAGGTYPSSMNAGGLRALYDNLGKNAEMASNVDKAVRNAKKDDWRGNRRKGMEVFNAIMDVLHNEDLAEQVFELVKNQAEY